VGRLHDEREKSGRETKEREVAVGEERARRKTEDFIGQRREEVRV